MLAESSTEPPVLPGLLGRQPTPSDTVDVAPSPRHRLAQLPVFYGWIIVAAALVTMAIGVNARTAFSLLFPAMLDEFGWDRGPTAGAFSFGFLVSAFLSPGIGRLMDLKGPRLFVEFGVFCWRWDCCRRPSRTSLGRST